MRLLFSSIIVLFGFAGCNTPEEPACPKIWELERGQISANAMVDDGKLYLEVWNPVAPNAVTLLQSPLIADFEISLSVEQMNWDTLISPQFRLEVFDPLNEAQEVSGVSINPAAFYCYVGTAEPENRDMRIMHYPTGTIRVSRRADTLSCMADVGGVSMTYERPLHTNNMAVRMVFGSTTTSTGNTYVVLDDFQGLNNLLSSVVVESGVQSDDFECQSW